MNASTPFTCIALDTPCTHHQARHSGCGTAVPADDAVPMEAAPGFLLVGTTGVVLRQSASSFGLPDLTGCRISTAFESLSDLGGTSWPRVTADCARVSRDYVWRLRDGRPVAVQCACLCADPGAEEWLLRLSELPSDTGGQHELELLAQAVNQTDDAVMITCAGGLIKYVNPAFERHTGYLADEVLGRTPGLLKSGQHKPEFYATLWSTLMRGEVFRTVFTNRRRNGELYFEEKTISPILDRQQRISHFVSTSKDVSERMQAQYQLEYLASIDPLTDLPNRRLFLDRLNLATLRTARLDQHLAVLFIDLDRFKVINDTLGHSTGDGLLTEVARRLRTCVRAYDTVARLGGDEFTILLEEIADRRAASQVAGKILDVLAAGICIDEREFFVSASIGIALFPDNALSIDELLSRADLSMYRAKASGRNTFRFYEADMDLHARSDLSAEIALHGALERREFFIVYQPIVDAAGQAIAVEALLRWNNPAQGVVAPDRFIPILEETGLIVPVSRWSLREALAEVKRMQATRPGLRLSFNLSGRQLYDDGLADDIFSALDETGFDPRALELEITESTLMEDLPRTREILAALDARGIALAIDDFGTGYSSLSYLMRFSVRTLKIDRSFVRELPNSADAQTIVRAIMSLSDSMGLDVVAEGVETQAQFDMLTGLGCQRLQGYLFGTPSSPSDLSRLRCFQPPGRDGSARQP